MERERGKPIKGRGALSSLAGRFETRTREAVDDGWGTIEEPLPGLQTIVPDWVRAIVAQARWKFEKASTS